MIASSFFLVSGHGDDAEGEQDGGPHQQADHGRQAAQVVRRVVRVCVRVCRERRISTFATEKYIYQTRRVHSDSDRCCNEFSSRMSNSDMDRLVDHLATHHV